MTVIILSALSVGSLFKYSPKISLAVVWYITIQICSSYFISGVAKLRKKNWRNGAALKGFMKSTIYNEDKLTALFLRNSSLILISSWLIVLFEILFVTALISPPICSWFIVTAILFHIGNFYVFGLNRFIFAWLACYPALYYCSGG